MSKASGLSRLGTNGAIGSSAANRRRPRSDGLIERREDMMLITEQFSERTISRMDVALERACMTLPETFVHHGARAFVAERIVECAKARTQTLDGLTETGKRAVAELVMRERGMILAD